MNRRSSTKKSPKPVKPKSDPDGKLWFRQISDKLFQSTVSGSRSSTGTGEVDKVTVPEHKQSMPEMSRRVAPTGSSPIGHSSMRYSPGADPGMLWRKLIQERQKNKILQVRACCSHIILYNYQMLSRSRLADSKHLLSCV